MSLSEELQTLGEALLEFRNVFVEEVKAGGWKFFIIAFIAIELLLILIELTRGDWHE